MGALHYIGFVHPDQGKDARLARASLIFGPPDFVHRRWDERAWQEIGPGDVAIFAEGDASAPRNPHAFDDSANV